MLTVDHVCVRVGVYKDVRVRVYTDVRVHVGVMCVYVCKYIHIYIYTWVSCAYTYIRTMVLLARVHRVLGVWLSLSVGAGQLDDSVWPDGSLMGTG